jgi:hypothetical protein
MRTRQRRPLNADPLDGMTTILRSLRSIFATLPVSFQVPCTLDEALSRLSASTKRSPWRAWLDASPECLVGKVTRDAVVVRWYRGPRVPSQQFRGALLLAGDQVVLEGRFQHSPGERGLLVAAIVLLTLFLVVSLIGLVVLLAAPVALGGRFLAGGFLAALAISALIAIFFATQPLRQADIAQTSLAIRAALNTNPSNRPLERSGMNASGPADGTSAGRSAPSR